jgi:succinate-semialdehyde dehydrogenase/glutarate-semialdehyde dehydrogenase
VNAAETDLIRSVPTGAFIAGQWRESSTGRRFDVVDPATERVLCQVADAAPADAVAALDAAAGAQDRWAATSPQERGEILRRCYEAMIAREDELALLVTLEMGKPVAEARAEVRYAAEFYRWFAEEAVRIAGRWSTDPGGGGRLLTIKQPVGPCLLVTPWNFPLAMGARKIGPAIAAGCTMVVKAAQLTPLSMNLTAAILAEAGLPHGVLNVLTASSASSVTAPLINDSRLRKLSFTGSTEVGKLLVEQSAANLLRVSMELGGNAPFLVFADADLELAVEQAAIAKMRNMGESCVAANRFYVHRSVAEEFAERLAAALVAMPIGRGTEPGVTVGPLIDDRQRGKVASLVDNAVSAGARIRAGGGAVEGDGYFWAPTVLTDVAVGARMHREEIFGPVAPIYSFDTEEEALRLANDTEYGLIAYVFCRDFQRSIRVVERLETGMVGLNKGLVSNAAAPFGGVKWSGLGREGGPEGIGEYLNTKYAGIAA